MLCSSLLADKISHFEVLSDHRMGSDHAPILCTLGVEKEFRVGVTAPNLALISIKRIGINMIKF